jgi:methanogenic corrinoid protein MtbC1
MNTALDNRNEYALLAKEYLGLIMKVDRYSASKLILDAVDEGLSIKDLYLHVFQPTLYEIGRLWQNNEITVAKEHFCTAVTQFIMSQLYPKIISSKKKDLNLFATCVGGELHEIGIRMVADFFEMEGWNTFFTGASTPVESIIRSIEEFDTDVLAISTSMTFNIIRVKELIDKVNEALPEHKVKIMVGGRPFNISPGIWKSVNADFYASDASTAIDIAEEHISIET